MSPEHTPFCCHPSRDESDELRPPPTTGKILLHPAGEPFREDG